MRQLVVFSLVCVTLAFCKGLPRVMRSPPADISIEQMVLNQITMIVLMHNSTGLPTDGDKKIPLPKLTSCISVQQREAIKNCGKETGDQKSPRPHHFSPPELTKITECILSNSDVIGKEGTTINRTNLKNGFIGLSTLTAAQKTLAADSLNTCLDADLSSSPALQGKPMPGMTERVKTIHLAAFCSFKALIENGCAEHATSAKMISHKTAGELESDSSDSVETLHDLSESDETMSQMREHHRKCAGGATHHHCGSSSSATAAPSAANASAAAGAAAAAAASSTAKAQPAAASG